MKRRIALAVTMAVVIPALLTGCRKEQGADGSSAGAGDGFTASILQNGASDLYSKCGVENHCPATKTYLTSDDKVAWSTDDQIIVAGDSEQTMTVVPFGTDATTAMLSGTAPDPATAGRKYAGFYPATGWWNASTKLVTLPAIREYNASNPLDGVPMYAESDDRHLEFKPLFGLFEFTLTGNKTVNAIKLVAAGANLSGTFGMNSAGNAVYKSNGVDSAVVTFPGGIIPNTGFKTYIAVPAGQYTKLTVIVRTDATDTWGGIYSKVLAPSDKITVNGGEVYSSSLSTSDWDGVQLWAGGCYWSTVDLGGETPDDRGDFFAWGASEVAYSQTRDDGSTIRYTLKDAAPEAISEKYPAWNASEGFVAINAPYYKGTAYTKYTTEGEELGLCDDAARVLWGGNWRIPSEQDFLDLINNTDKSNESGSLKVTGRGNDFSSSTILLTVSSLVSSDATASRSSDNSTGYVRYWSRTLATETQGLGFGNRTQGSPTSIYSDGVGLERFSARRIRPVLYL